MNPNEYQETKMPKKIVVKLGRPVSGPNPDTVTAWFEIIWRQIVRGDIPRPLNAGALVMSMRRCKVLFKNIASDPMPMAEAVFARLCDESDLAHRAVVADAGPSRAALREQAAAMPEAVVEQRRSDFQGWDDETAS